MERPLSDANSHCTLLAFQRRAARKPAKSSSKARALSELAATNPAASALDIKEIQIPISSRSPLFLELRSAITGQPYDPQPSRSTGRAFPDAAILTAVAERRRSSATLVTSEGKSLTEIKLR